MCEAEKRWLEVKSKEWEAEGIKKGIEQGIEQGSEKKEDYFGIGGYQYIR